MTMTEYFLISERLGFRYWAESDFDLAWGLWGDERVTGLIDARGKLSEAQVRDRLRREIATAAASGVQYWPIFLLASGDHVGCCGLRPYGQSTEMFELGFHIRFDHWGQGYATEAARAVIGYAFEVRRVAGLFAGHNPKNNASRRVLQKLGFQYSHNEWYEPTGLHHPSYFLTESQYRQWPGQ